jgi:hypothetical protein
MSEVSQKDETKIPARIIRENNYMIKVSILNKGHLASLGLRVSRT